jgi:hypothetical protein
LVSQLDATLFGHLAQFTECPLQSKEIKPMLEKSASNLVGFVQRMKRRYWPDWEEIIQHLAMNPEDVGSGGEAVEGGKHHPHQNDHHHQHQHQHQQQVKAH